MLVKMLVNVGSCRRGQVVRVAQRVASMWCESGRAVPVCQLDTQNMETAVAPPVDASGNHTEKVPRKRRRKRRKN